MGASGLSRLSGQNASISSFDEIPTCGFGPADSPSGARAPARTAQFLILALVASVTGAVTAADKVEEQFRDRIEPILEDYCAGCHGNGMKKGGLALDEFTPESGPTA